MSVAVEIEIANVNENGVFLTARNIHTFDVVAYAVTFEELFSNNEVRVSSTMYPLTVDSVSHIRDQRKMVDLLVSCREELENLRIEKSSTSDSARYKVLTELGNPIHILEKKIRVLQLIIDVSVWAVFGKRVFELARLC